MGCQIYMSRVDAGGVASTKREKDSERGRDSKWEREKCVNIHCDGLWHCSPCKQE